MHIRTWTYQKVKDKHENKSNNPNDISNFRLRKNQTFIPHSRVRAIKFQGIFPKKKKKNRVKYKIKKKQAPMEGNIL